MFFYLFILITKYLRELFQNGKDKKNTESKLPKG